MELRSALSARFTLDLPATLVFDYPTPAALAAFVASQLGTAVSGTSGGGSQVAELGAWAPPAAEQQASHLITDVVGVGCRYPGEPASGTASTGTGLSGFWAAVAAGASLQRMVPLQRWDVDWCYSVEASPGRSYARFAAFVEVRTGREGEARVQGGVKRQVCDCFWCVCCVGQPARWGSMT